MLKAAHQGTPPDTARGDAQKPVVQYRILGRTGLKVSVVGFGAMRTTDPNVIHYALDKGVNYIDTAACYMDGNNEIIVGQVLKTRRQDAYIATKCHIDDEDKMLASVERSLRRLNVDQLDIIQLHNLKKRKQVQHRGAMRALQKMRDRGMVRFVGFTTHENQVEVIRGGLETEFYDMVLVAYNFKSDKEIADVIGEAAKAGLGVVAMKTQAGGYRTRKMGDWSPHQAALRWVLQNPHVHTTIPSMVTFAQVDENVGAMRARFGYEDQRKLEQYGRAIDRILCRMCGRCEETCPHGVAVAEINRCLMYAEGYGDYDLALRAYRELSVAENLTRCAQCSKCTVSCFRGVEVKAKLERARALFARSVS